MISEEDKKIIQFLSRKYQAKKVILFGSSLNSEAESNDIDIAVEGISPGLFFKYYGELMMKLSKSVDVIDLYENSKFTSLIREEGLPIYG